jgi:hypothetical protein
VVGWQDISEVVGWLRSWRGPTLPPFMLPAVSLTVPSQVLNWPL